MSYRTTCPHCESVFGVGPGQLDAAEGWVQCSVCGGAFDAHLSLLLLDGSPLPEMPPEPPIAEPELVPATNLAPSVSLEGASGPAEPPAPVALPPEMAAYLDDPEFASDVAETDADQADPVPQGIVQREADDGLPSIILIDPDAEDSDDPGPMPHIAAPMYPRPSPGASPYNRYTRSPEPVVPRLPVGPAARVEYAEMPTRTLHASRKLPTWVSALIAGVLLLALLAQSAYFLRDTLVSYFPDSRPAATQICEVLGCTLSLPKKLALLQIVGSDLQTETNGRLKLMLTLGNRAGAAQAWPVLMLTLTDQRNRPLARRSFAPSEYLGDPARIEAGIPARSEQVLTLPLNVRDLAPMGFDLRLMY